MENCYERKVHRTEEDKKKMLNRLKKAEGQIKGIEKMVEMDAYCPDIMTQVAAVQAALDGFNKVLLTAHIKGCVVQDILAGKEEAPEELAELVRRLMR